MRVAEQGEQGEYVAKNPGAKFDLHGAKVTYLYLSVVHRRADVDSLAYWKGRAAQVGWTEAVSEFTGSREALTMFALICTHR